MKGEKRKRQPSQKEIKNLAQMKPLQKKGTKEKFIFLRKIFHKSMIVFLK